MFTQNHESSSQHKKKQGEKVEKVKMYETSIANRSKMMKNKELLKASLTLS